MRHRDNIGMRERGGRDGGEGERGKKGRFHIFLFSETHYEPRRSNVLLFLPHLEAMAKEERTHFTLRDNEHVPEMV